MDARMIGAVNVTIYRTISDQVYEYIHHDHQYFREIFNN